MKKITRELLKAYIIVTVNENPYSTGAGIKEMLNQKLKTSLHGLRLTAGVDMRRLCSLLGELKKHRIIFRDPSRRWRINLQHIKHDQMVDEERMELYRHGLSDNEIARRQGRRASAIHLWRKTRGLKANYPPGWRGAVLSHARLLKEESK